MGKLLAEGEIPYVNYWEMKPVFSWYIYSLLYKLSFNSIFYFRFFGAILIALNSSFLFLISNKILKGLKKSLFIAILFSVAQSFLLLDGKEILTEHIVLTFFLVGLYAIINKKFYFVAGIFFCLSILIRLNFALPIMGIFIYVFFNFFKKKNNLFQLLKLTSPSVLIPFFITAYYFYIGEFSIFFDSNVTIPRIYSTLGYDGKNVIDMLIIFLTSLLTPNDINIYNRFIFWVISFSGFLFLFKKMKFSDDNLNLFSLSGILTLISIIPGGKFFPHYLIQITPYASFFFVVFFSFFKTKKKIIFSILFIIPLFLTLKYPIDEMKNVIKYKGNYKSYGCATSLFHYLKKTYKSDEIVFAEICNIIYFYLDQKPPTKFIHPSWIRHHRSEVVKIVSNNIIKEQYENILNNSDYLILSYKMDNMIKSYQLDKRYLTSFKLLKEFKFSKEFYRAHTNVFVYKKTN